MSKPKRHHWWPVAQSKQWTDRNGLIFVTRSDGTHFQTSPLNIGVESELYTRFGDNDSKDTDVEDWFAQTIDGPATTMIEHLLDPSHVRRSHFVPDRSKAQVARRLGYRIHPYLEKIELPPAIRTAIARYVAALLVRHPTYLRKLVQFHRDVGPNARNRALDNMLDLYSAYAERIEHSVFIVSRTSGDAEYLYADGGVMVKEPWSQAYGIPFDIHAPITPDLAIAVLPVPNGGVDLRTATVAELTNQGVARHNRIVLAGAERFVFSRRVPPGQFIAKYFGKPAPESIGYRIVDSRLETFHDPSRD